MHCLFWRPKDDLYSQAWYRTTSRRVKTAHKMLDKEDRWGLFIERVYSCKYGRKMPQGDLPSYIDELRNTLRTRSPESVVYVLFITGADLDTETQ